ncbi:hypothetical protein [Nocardioides stalactiti]|uniref:hypothetical protein n=1 Tax=Nocardioides stalactiti TaxID=2755356 RepID=UPI0016033644|nr:hypothetical protein [Nocardioides stalactiti]
MDDYRAAAAIGGRARAYCGVVELVPRLDPAEVEETTEAQADDCVTCADIWNGLSWVRL